MKKKNIIILIIVVIIAIIIGTTIFLINKNNNEGKLEKIYEKISDGQDYICTIEENENNKIIIAKKGENYITETFSKIGDAEEVEHTSTLIKDDKMYYILHNREEYYTYPKGNNEQNILLDELSQIISEKYEKGKEKINGKTYKYEQYNGVFIFSTELETENENSNTKFYFKGNELAYMKTVIDNKQKIRKIELKYEVNDSVFEIPSNYAEV